MERNERLKAADKCASKYTKENEAHIARAAFMLGCEFEAQGEIVKGVVLEAETSYDTLSEEPDKSLEEAIRLWVAGVFLAYTFPDTTVKTLREIVEKTFIAGAEWQKAQP